MLNKLKDLGLLSDLIKYLVSNGLKTEVFSFENRNNLPVEFLEL